jgi:hypothetical protein
LTLGKVALVDETGDNVGLLKVLIDQRSIFTAEDAISAAISTNIIVTGAKDVYKSHVAVSVKHLTSDLLTHSSE